MITIRMGDAPDHIIRVLGNNGAVMSQVEVSCDPALATFQATGNGYTFIVHPASPGTTNITATGLNENAQQISGNEQLVILPPVATSLLITLDS